MSPMKLRSPAFGEGEPIPARHAHEKSGGQNASPPLQIEDVPEEARSVALMMYDPDANDFVHWVVLDLPARTQAVPEGASSSELPDGARELYTTAGSPGYYGPNPPPRSGAHRYVFEAYALDVPSLEVDEHPSHEAFAEAVRGHAVAEADTYGLFENR